MKLLKKNISAKDGSGTVLIRPDTSEDLWYSYNLLMEGDLVRCTTVRKVVKESNTGSTTSSKKRLSLTIAVKKIDFDPDSLQVRISGTTQSENDFVRLGAHHTLTLELHQNFSIEKDSWDQIYLDILDEATNPERQAEVAAVILQMGLAHICLITGPLTITKAKIEMNIPKKRSGYFSSSHSKAITKFYDAIYRGIVQHIDFDKIKCVLLASPGFVKDDLFKYMQTKAVQQKHESKISPIVDNKDKFVLCKSSSGHKFALDEVFSDQNIMSKLTDTKLSEEVNILGKFMKMMDTDIDRAYYGYHHVKMANDQAAIGSLLITDELFRNSDVKTRRQYVSLVESVRENGGKAFIFSSMHVSGQQLQQVSGVAAILRYPIPDLDELEEEAANLNLDNDETDENDEEDDYNYQNVATEMCENF